MYVLGLVALITISSKLNDLFWEILICVLSLAIVIQVILIVYVDIQVLFINSASKQSQGSNYYLIRPIRLCSKCSFYRVT